MPEAIVELSVSDVVGRGGRRLAAAGCDTPRLDAELLLAEALAVSRERLLLDAPAPVGSQALQRFEALLARRIAREPVAYIVGRKDFRRITLSVDRRALVPRPETELLVEVGASLPQGARVVEVGTGSGAVALALKDERPDLDVWATEISGDALGLARHNAARLGLEVRFKRADLLAGVPARFDAVLANLPYVADGDELPPEIALYEPASALFGGPDGLAVLRRMVEMLGRVPMAALEVGLGQAPAVSELMLRSGFASAERVCDLAGHERVVVARR